MLRIGHANDTHRLVKGRPLILGGVTIDYDYGLLGHSDADVVYHVVAEAIIGALAQGDLGTHFPDTDSKYKDIDSSILVKESLKLARQDNYHINNLDITIFIEKPILAPFIPKMKSNLSKLLSCDKSQINIKATRREKLGFIGRKEGVSAECVILLIKSN